MTGSVGARRLSGASCRLGIWQRKCASWRQISVSTCGTAAPSYLYIYFNIFYFLCTARALHGHGPCTIAMGRDAAAAAGCDPWVGGGGRQREHLDLADVRWMREKWRELMTRTHGDFQPPPFQ